MVVALAVAIPARAELPPLPEMATTSALLAGLWLVRPEKLGFALDLRWAAILATAGSLQLLVKFSAGVVTLVVCAIVVLARPRRVQNAGVAAVAAIAAFCALWLAAGQRFGDSVRWLRFSFDVAAGYTSGMFINPDSGMRFWILLLVPLVALGIVAWMSLRVSRLRALPFVTLMIIGVWFAAKAGFVRLDA
jgi:hypothetical protein